MARNVQKLLILILSLYSAIALAANDRTLYMDNIYPNTNTGVILSPVEYVSVYLPNDSGTGTTLNKLAYVDGSGNAKINPAGNYDGVVGVVVAGAGTTGYAKIAVAGKVTCTFDGTVTQYGGYVTASASVAGDCHDAGITYPTAGQSLGFGTQTRTGAGTATMLAFTMASLNYLSASNLHTGTIGSSILSGSLDNLGNTQGDILYRNASGWVPLGAGTSGFFLKTQGAGANPVWSVATGFANPMTTLGDIIYEDATPAPARLGGNTTSTKKYLSQTGTGTISAVPAWAQIAAADLSNGVQGSGAVVLATSPTLTTPVLGVASATTINRVTLTAPATGSTLTIADGKTLTCSNTLSLAGTDGSTLNIGAGGTLGTLAFLSDPLAVNKGGTGLSTLTAHAVYVGNGASNPTALAVGATNTLLHGNTGADPSYSAIVNADITNSTIDLTTKVTGVLPAANVGGARTINAQTGTSYTFALTDAANAGGFPLVTGSNASAETFTVPPQSSVVWLAGAQIDVCQIGAGKLTLAQGAGVTINSLSSNKSVGGQYVCVTLVRTASDTWLLTGNLIP